MRQSGRWQLTDFQRFLVVAAVVTSMFLAAMAFGMGSIVLLLVSVLLIVVVWLGIFLLGVRFNGRAGLSGEAQVVMAPPPPANQIIGRCDLRLVVDLPGRSSTDMKLRDPAVPVTKWPRIGQVLPVEVDARNARQIRIRWDLVDEYKARPTSGAPALEATAFAVPFFTDYADGALEAEYSPTPRTPVIDQTPSPPPATIAVEEYRSGTGPAELSDPIHWGGPLDLEELDALHPDSIEDSPTPPRPGDVETIEVEPSARAEAAGFELPVRGIPHPRRDERPVTREIATSKPADDGESHAMGVMLVVSDLARSVRFYRDLVGFTVVDSSATTAVLAYGGGRVLLRQLADMSPVDRRVAHLHISVNDVEAAYSDLRAKGVPFAHKPRVINRGDKLDLWAATFRDPDGHDVAITQWRDRDEIAPA